MYLKTEDELMERFDPAKSNQLKILHGTISEQIILEVMK